MPAEWETVFFKETLCMYIGLTFVLWVRACVYHSRAYKDFAMKQTISAGALIYSTGNTLNTSHICVMNIRCQKSKNGNFATITAS